MRCRLQDNYKERGETEMKKLLLAVAVFLFSTSATSAFAKDLCVVNNFGQLFKFDNVKLLKGKTTPLVGRIHPFGSDFNQPITGSVTLDSDNATVRISILGIPLPGSGLVSFVASMIGDKNFNALGQFDNAPLETLTNSDAWTAVPCIQGFFPAAFVTGPLVGPAPGIPQ
jgi:hypothetical protein